MKTFFVLLTFAVCAYGQNGLGKSTLTCLDKDGDGYGVGPGCLGPDADDYDSGVHSAAQAISKYGTLGAFLSHRGYTPSHIWYLAPAVASPNCVVSIGSCVGNDSTGVEDDINHPFLNWSTIVARVAPNHLVMMRDNYNSRINVVSGTSGNPVIYLSFPGEAAYFNQATYPGATLLILDVSWIVIDGVKATQSACLQGGSTASYPSATTFHDNIFQNLECTSGGGSQGLGGFSAFNGLVNITLQDNVFHDNNGPNQQHEIYIGSRTLPSSNVYVRRNIAYKSNEYPGIQINGRVTNLVMEQNLVYNVPGASGYSWMEGVSNSFFRNNISFNVGAEGLAIVNYDGDCYVGSASSGICPYDQTGNVIENNTFYTGAVGPDGVATVQPALEIVNLSTGCPSLGRGTYVHRRKLEILAATSFLAITYLLATTAERPITHQSCFRCVPLPARRPGHACWTQPKQPYLPPLLLTISSGIREVIAARALLVLDQTPVLDIPRTPAPI